MAERLAGSPTEVARLRRPRELGISPKRYNGWEPRVVYRGFDRDGNPCLLSEAWEVVGESEPEWDDLQRALIEGLERHEAELCQTCGFHESLTDVEAHDFAIETKVCDVCAERDRADRMIAKKDETDRKSKWGDEPPAERRDRADGRRLLVRYKGKAQAAASKTPSNRPSPTAE